MKSQSVSTTQFSFFELATDSSGSSSEENKDAFTRLRTLDGEFLSS